MVVRAIVACDDNLGIGLNGDMPWGRIPQDLRWFRECTMGKVVVMGRRTWDSIGQMPLAGRINVVMTTRSLPGLDQSDVYSIKGTASQVVDWVKSVWDEADVWFMGGANVYEQAFPICEEVYVTRIAGAYRCDTHLKSEWFKDFVTVEEWTDRDDKRLTFTKMKRI